jgi:hypothetical protein
MSLNKQSQIVENKPTCNNKSIKTNDIKKYGAKNVKEIFDEYINNMNSKIEKNITK